MQPHTRFYLSHLLLVTALAALPVATPARAAEALPKPGETKNFTIGKDDFLLDGKRLQIRCGEIHAARVPREYWQHRLRMCKAMGLNTVCAYLFWNMHEPEEGKFNWNDRADIAEFCRLAAAEGLWVILRPGPYACAEWEMGGTPWWLLRKTPIELRSRDPKYMEAAKRYLREVGRVLGPLQVTRGGPILMVQVENEYGFYGKDTDYMREMRQAVLDAGFDVPLVRLQPDLQTRGRQSRRSCFTSSISAATRTRASTNCANSSQGPADVRRVLSRMVRHLGQSPPPRQHRRLPARPRIHAQAQWLVQHLHGPRRHHLRPLGRRDRPFKPDTSSYDYDAPISEAGWATEKFHLTREIVRQIPAARRNPSRHPRADCRSFLSPPCARSTPPRSSPTCPNRCATRPRATWKPTALATAASSTARSSGRATPPRSKPRASPTSAMFSSMANRRGASTAAVAIAASSCPPAPRAAPSTF